MIWKTAEKVGLALGSDVGANVGPAVGVAVGIVVGGVLLFCHCFIFVVSSLAVC
jgi:tetrahydromethanopterin S-methyltransferase subunit G